MSVREDGWPQAYRRVVHGPVTVVARGDNADDSAERPQTRRWTRREYEWAAEAGMFGAEERLELLDGRYYKK